MGPCSEDPHLRWASWLLGLAELAGVLLGVCGTGPLSSGGADSRAHISLKRVQGGSVLFHVTRELEGDSEAQLEQIEWRFGPETTYTVLLRVGSGGDLPTWVGLQDKYRHRVHVPNMRSLLIENLTTEDSGQYRARGSFTGGRGFTQVFQLTVYEPVPLPQILAKSLSVTADWCNVTLECRAVGASEDLNVTWWHSDIPRKWQQTGTLGPGPSVLPLAVRLPLDQANTNLTCAASNQEDLKTATTTLRNVCAQGKDSQEHDSGRHMLGLVVAVPAVLLTVGVGLYLWKTRGKKKEETETGTGVGLEEGRRNHEDDIHYVELRKQEPKEGGDKGVRGQHLEGKRPVTTIYSEVHRPGPAMKVI
ncbi:PREDICTED: SLAM family member 5-like isoform X2 [Hipposideros armiger]|uniref:SLAM family member 5-like isoform X2 n=1 Tax=Hipposideros armiger TaxID=186990 RepID=A0A8B7QQ01_HIPAR|nr:PREDICTED: SLAM family member 5-like isoform X2 [Hipposideros armiger]